MESSGATHRNSLMRSVSHSGNVVCLLYQSNQSHLIAVAEALEGGRKIPPPDCATFSSGTRGIDSSEKPAISGVLNKTAGFNKKKKKKVTLERQGNGSGSVPTPAACGLRRLASSSDGLSEVPF